MRQLVNTMFINCQIVSLVVKGKFGKNIGKSQNIMKLIPGDITQESWEKAIQFHGTFHGLKITNCVIFFLQFILDSPAKRICTFNDVSVWRMHKFSSVLLDYNLRILRIFTVEFSVKEANQICQTVKKTVTAYFIMKWKVNVTVTSIKFVFIDCWFLGSWRGLNFLTMKHYINS